MLFINISGQLVFRKAFDLHTMTEVPVPDGILEKISLSGIFLCTFNETKVIKGLILIPEGPMLIVSRPILTSYDEGPAKGTLIMGRYYDSSQVACIAQQTHLSITMERLDDSTLPEDFQTAHSHISEQNPIYIQPLNSEIVAGYTLIRDILRQPILILKVDIERTIYNHGLHVINTFYYYIFGTSVVFGVTSAIVFERSILSPLKRLSAEVTNIAKKRRDFCTNEHEG